MKRQHLKYKYQNVLLLDDNDLDNFINQKMLESVHFSKNISVNTNGGTVLANLNLIINSEHPEDFLPEVIFVDLNMPVMSGFEFIENLKRIDYPELRKCRVIILTSSIHNEDRIKADKLDSNIVFLNKPLTNDLINNL